MLAGRLAWVTGASGGIGAAIARRFASEGARLVLAGRDRARLEALAAEIDRPDATPIVLAYDMRDDAAIAAAFQQVFKEAKRLDVLVNNAGVMLDAPLGLISRAAIDETLQVNVAAALAHLQSASKLMARSGGGSIVNIASIIGVHGNANQTLYAASKAALIGATRAAAKELAPKGIRVNALAPGFIDTPMTSAYPEAVRAKTLASIGMGRAGTGDDVAKVALFLASDLSAYVTGQVIGVDGGMVI